MPELPDAESFRKYIDSTSLHKKIKDVEIRSKTVRGEVFSQNSSE